MVSTFYIFTQIYIIEFTINPQCLKENKTLISFFFFKQLLYILNASEFKLHNKVDTVITFKAWISLTEILQVKKSLLSIWLLNCTVFGNLLVYFWLVELHWMLTTSQMSTKAAFWLLELHHCKVNLYPARQSKDLELCDNVHPLT